MDSLHFTLSLQYLQEFGTPWPSRLKYLVPIVAATYYYNLSYHIISHQYWIPPTKGPTWIIRSNMIQDRSEDPGWTPLAIAAKNNRILAGISRAIWHGHGLANHGNIPMTDPWCCYNLLYMVCHGSHPYTPFMLAFFYQHHGSVMGYWKISMKQSPSYPERSAAQRYLREDGKNCPELDVDL